MSVGMHCFVCDHTWDYSETDDNYICPECGEDEDVEELYRYLSDVTDL